MGKVYCIYNICCISKFFKNVQKKCPEISPLLKKMKSHAYSHAMQ